MGKNSDDNDWITPDCEPANNRAGDAAKPSEHDDGEHENHILAADARKDRDIRQDHGAAECRQSDAERKGQLVHQFRIDPHQPRGRGVLRGGAHRAPKPACAHEPPQQDAANERHRKGDQVGNADEQRPQRQCRGLIRRRHRAELRSEQQQRSVLDDNQDAHGQKYLRHRRRRQNAGDQLTLHDPADRKRNRERQWRGQHRIEPEKIPGEPRHEHADGEKLGLREIDDPHDAIDQRQSDRDHRIDTADQESVEDGLKKGHRRRQY